MVDFLQLACDGSYTGVSQQSTGTIVRSSRTLQVGEGYEADRRSGKENKCRVVPLNLDVRRAIEQYLKVLPTVAAENLPADERRSRAQEGYAVGSVSEPVPSVVALTVPGSDLAASAMLTMLSEDGEAAPTVYLIDAGSSTRNYPAKVLP